MVACGSRFITGLPTHYNAILKPAVYRSSPILLETELSLNWHFLHHFFEMANQWMPLKDMPNLKGKIAVVTGGKYATISKLPR